MTMEYLLLLAALHALVVIVTAAVNFYGAGRRAATASLRDATSLRAALAAELAHLSDLYKENIDAIYAGKDALASCRMFSVIYRGNLCRIHTLPAEDIPAIVAAYALSERIESFAAAHCKAQGATAFSLGKERPFAEALVATYEKAAAAAERALRRLGAADEAEAAPQPRAARFAAA